MSFLDTKFNRSTYQKDPRPKEERLRAGKVGCYLPDSDSAKTQPGKEQWTRLEGELEKPADLRLKRPIRYRLETKIVEIFNFGAESKPA